MSHGTDDSGRPVDPLQDLVAALPREQDPGRDLWPAIEARLEPRQGRASRSSRTVVTPRWSYRDWGLQALAALFFMAVGGLLTLWAVAPQTLVPGTGEHGRDLDSVHGPGTMTGTVPAAFAEGDDPLMLVEVSYLRAKDALWLQALQNQDALPPGTLKVVEKNLQILERAIHDLRQALELDPGNPSLERRLMDNHQRGIDLLRKVVREV